MRIIAGFAALPLVFASTGSAWALEKITLGYTAAIGTQYSDIFYGKTLGFFAEEGLDPQFVVFQGTPVVAAQVTNKSITFGAGAEPSLLIINMAKNTPVPVKFFYRYLRSTVYDFAVPEDSPIKSLQDMKGKKIGVHSLASGNIPLTKTALRKAGLNPNTDVTLVPVGTGPAAWKQLQEGRVDVLNMWFSENSKMTSAGLKIRTIPLPEDLQPIFTGSFFAHEDTIKEKPEMIAGFGRAMAKSSIACEANREACAKSYWTYDPTSRPSPDKEAEWVKGALASIESNAKSVFYFPDGKRAFGSFAPGSLKSYAESLRESELISRTDFDTDQAFTNAFVEKFNAFDPKDAVAKAKATN
jgi:NitT/TauT family transport system substrate-binding protein